MLDKSTSELVERSTYQAYGATESDYRPERRKGFREDYRFTGKEEDIEVGLQYFGFRYLSPHLNRWISADPLTVQGLGADPNVYAYVSGRALQAVDPCGLDGESKLEDCLMCANPEDKIAVEGDLAVGFVNGSQGRSLPKPPPIDLSIPQVESVLATTLTAAEREEGVGKFVGYGLAPFALAIDMYRSVPNAPGDADASGQHGARAHALSQAGYGDDALEASVLSFVTGFRALSTAISAFSAARNVASAGTRVGAPRPSASDA